MIVLSNPLAKKMIHLEAIEGSNVQLAGKHFHAVVISVVGLAMVAWAIPELTEIFANIYYLEKTGDELAQKSLKIGTRAYAVGLTVQCIIGILLFWGSKGISSIWFFLQKTRPMSKPNA